MGVDSTILGMACVLVGIIGKLADTSTSDQMDQELKCKPSVCWVLFGLKVDGHAFMIT